MDSTDLGLLPGTNMMSFTLDIQARGGNFSISPALVVRSSTPLSNKSAIVHSAEVLSREAGVAWGR